MKLSSLLGLAVVAAVGLAVVPAFLPTGPGAAFDAEGLLQSGRFVVAAGAIFVGGLLTSLTPCVYPLIPITVGVFGARRAEGRLQAVLLTTSYVVGMGLVFASLGVVAALSGKAFGSALGNPWVAGGLAVFLLALAASMFGAFDLALPQGLASRLSRVGGGGLVGAFLMGSVSGFLAAPCTGPVLSGVLAFVAATQNPLLGGVLLFVYALGIGVLFFAIGVFTVRLPRGGAWMDWVKSFFGVALVVLAFSYLRDVNLLGLRSASEGAGALAGKVPLIALASLVAFAGVLVGALTRSFKGSGGDFALKLVGVALLVLATLARTGAGQAPPVGSVAVRLGLAEPSERVAFKWDLTFPAKDTLAPTTEAFDLALARARADGRPVMIDFYADWCAACKELDEITYVETSVRSRSGSFVNIKVDATEEDEAVQELFGRFGVQGLPTVVFVDPQGRLLEEPRVSGFVPPRDFVATLDKVIAGNGERVSPCAVDTDCPQGKSCRHLACLTPECPRQCG